MNQTTIGRSLLTLALGVSLAACGGAAGQDDESSEANTSTTQASAVEYMITKPLASTDPATAAANLQADNQWWPAGCVTRVKDASQPIVTLTLNNCTGPFGLVKWSGTVTVTFSKNGDGSLNAKATSNNMTANGSPATFTMDRNITLTPGSASREVKGSTTWQRTTANGVQVNHTANWTATVDATTRCRTVNGSGVTTVGGASVTTAAKDYKVCRPNGVDQCPTGSLSHTTASGTGSVTVTFDGSNQATVTGPRGTRQVGLVCGQ